MKISVITLQTVRNYGSALQAFATQNILENAGFEVEFVNYIRKDVCDENLIKTWTQNDIWIKKAIKSAILYPTVKKWRKVFNGFLEKNLNSTSRKYTDDDDFKKYPIEADIYCTGSDQVWNSSWNKGIIKPLFLNYAPDNKKKISLAASFGKNELNKFEIDETKKLLERYDSISVRESSGIRILESLGIHNAIHVLDPTMIVSKEFWQKNMGKRLIKEDYVLIYQLNSDKKFDDYAKEFAKRKGMKLVRMCTRYDQVLKSGHSILIPEVLEFVSLLNYASYVITDSFHATAFSINLNKEFICIYPHEFSSRIDSILKIMHLENRHLQSFSNFDICNTSINYKNVKEILDEKRDNTYKFLKQALEA